LWSRWSPHPFHGLDVVRGASTGAPVNTLVPFPGGVPCSTVAIDSVHDPAYVGVGPAAPAIDNAGMLSATTRVPALTAANNGAGIFSLDFP
jgi:hypothetical protein